MQLSERTGQLVAVGILVLALTALYVNAIEPIIAWHRVNSERISVLQNQLARVRALGAQESDAMERLNLLEKTTSTSQYYLSDDTIALASARLQQYLKRVVNQAGGRLISTQMLDDPDGDSTSRVILRAQIKADIRGVLKVLFTLESGFPLLFLDDVVLTAHPSTRAASRYQPGDMTQMGMQLSVIGYLDSGHEHE